MIDTFYRARFFDGPMVGKTMMLKSFKPIIFVSHAPPVRIDLCVNYKISEPLPLERSFYEFKAMIGDALYYTWVGSRRYDGFFP